MRRGVLGLALALALAALGGCRARDNDPGPGGVTVGEARQLDEAAEKLEREQKPRQPAPASTGAPDGSGSTGP